MLDCLTPESDAEHMCDKIIAWVPDERVDGAHNLAPVFCKTYVELLEQYLRKGGESSADSVWLSNVQKNLLGWRFPEQRIQEAVKDLGSESDEVLIWEGLD